MGVFLFLWRRDGPALFFLMRRVHPKPKPFPAGPAGPCGPGGPCGPTGPAGPTHPHGTPLMARYSAPPFPEAEPIPEAKVVLTPAGADFMIFAGDAPGAFATQKVPTVLQSSAPSTVVKS